LRSESLTLLQLLAPTIFVLGAIYLLGSMLPMARGWARHSIFAVVWLVAAWYLHWRLFATVLPATGAWYEVGWLWLCFTIELLAIVDQFILYLTFLRTSDHSAEADRHEGRVRALPPEHLPAVDVYIPTYNEPIEVLEKTMTGALCLDYPNLSIWVLDDGRRPWLKAFCETKGVGYLNRPDNAHAKAGNINHALTRTSAEFVAMFDADFVPQRNFLMRTIGFFSDPEIGIVQTPHAFYNYDPMQVNLALRKSLPDEQRFFFDVIMPSRDAWDAAFCCGSNSVTRRAALRAVGDALPTQSITEDMLLSMTMLRKGYVTRYLCERLAFGLAPETVDAFFTQRQRWARGAIQILYLANGPLGRNLTVMQRLLFLPTHWLSLGLRSLIAIVAPIVFLWTGISPVFDVTAADVVYYFVPMVLALTGGVWAFAPGRHFPLASQVQGTFLSFKILPTVLGTLVKPFGHPFKVTPKGGTSQTSNYARGIFWAAASLMGLTVFGLIINTIPEWRIVESVQMLPVVAFWSAINVVVLFLICMMSLQAPRRRGEERFELDEPIRVIEPSGTISSGRIKDISLSGVRIERETDKTADTDETLAARAGDSVRVFITEVGIVSGTVVQQTGQIMRIQFILPPSVERDLLIRKMFTAGLDPTNVNASAWSATSAMLKSIWGIRTEMLERPAEETSDVVTASPVEKLPAQSLVISPQPRASHLSDLADIWLETPDQNSAADAGLPADPAHAALSRPLRVVIRA
jgi:cellulose synthase (UDP-forming)